jgi:hypothetical protein
MRNFEAPSAQARPSSTQPPPLHTPVSGPPPVPTANPLFASEARTSECSVNRPGASSFEGSVNRLDASRTEGVAKQAPGSLLHEAKGFHRAGRFAVDGRPTEEGGGTYELFTDASGRKVLLAGEFAANHKANVTQGAFRESTGFGNRKFEAGGPSGSGSDAPSDAPFGRPLQDKISQKPFTGGVLRQRKDANRSQEGFGVGVEGSKGGLENERAWSKDLPGGEHGRRIEKENVGSSGARVRLRAFFYGRSLVCFLCWRIDSLGAAVLGRQRGRLQRAVFRKLGECKEKRDFVLRAPFSLCVLKVSVVLGRPWAANEEKERAGFSSTGGRIENQSFLFGMLYFRFSGALLLVDDPSKSEHRSRLRTIIMQVYSLFAQQHPGNSFVWKGAGQKGHLSCASDCPISKS